MKAIRAPIAPARLGRRRLAALAAACVAVAGAASAETPEALVARCLGQIQRGNLEAAQAMYAPGALGDQGTSALEAAHDALQLGSMYPPVLLSSVHHLVDGQPIDSLLFQVRGATESLRVIAQTRRGPDGPQILGIQWESAPLEVTDWFPFVLTGMSYLHYYTLGAMIIVPLVILYAVVRCLWSGPGLQWLWLPFLVVGVGKWSARWIPGPPEGNIRLDLAALVLPGIEFAKNPAHEPWVLSVSLPLGAIVYLWWRRRKQFAESVADAQGEPSSTA